MAPYTFHLHDADGDLKEVRSALLAHDDAAIDHAGKLGHAHEIKVWQGERLVAHFPPVGSLRPSSY